jgi:trehalose transport system substrate-binding protein
MSEGSLSLATGAVIGLVLMLIMGFNWRWITPEERMLVSYTHREEKEIEKEVGRDMEDTLGANVKVEHIDSIALVRTLEEKIAAGTMPWDLISVDNDALEILVKKGLVQELSSYPRAAMLPGDRLFQDLQEKLRIDGRDYFVPLRANVKLLYYNQDMLRAVGHNQPPTTWDAMEQLARVLASADPASIGRVAIQAHRGKAAAVTVFEWVTSMGGNPLTLADAGARQAFTRLWNLAPYLEPDSNTIQFDTANEMLISNTVSVVDNWTYGIKEVMESHKKTPIQVIPGLEKSAHVLGGDVLAIPTGAPHPERAIKLIKKLVAKQTQHTLATKLFWAPVREDVYAELSAQKYFQLIWDALRNPAVVTRPTTPGWVVAEEVLSDALQEVLQKGRERGTPATDADIEALLGPYVARLREAAREYIPCAVVRVKTAGDGQCEVEVQTKKSFTALAHEFKTTPAILAKVNGRGEREFVDPETIPILLVPKPEPGS